MPGGIESGFTEVKKKEIKPRLLQCKGERYARVFEVPMEANSINEGDVFLLDMDTKIYFWVGEQCSVNERHKALEVANNIRKFERHCKCDILYPKTDDDADAEFWKILGGKPAKINPPISDAAAEAGDDALMSYKFYKISNETGKLLCQEVKDRPLTKAMLDTNDTFILELQKQVIIWIGRGANTEEKKNAIRIGQGFVKKNNKPQGTRVMRITEGAEDAYFRSFFNGFYDPIKKEDPDAKQDLGKIAAMKQKQYDDLMTKLGKNYSVKLYFIGDNRAQPEEVPSEEYGWFHKENVYMIDVKSDKHRYVIQWFGKNTNGDILSAMRKYADILTEGVLSNQITRTSVCLGHEDNTLLCLFNHFIVNNGKHEFRADHCNHLKESGGMWKIQAPEGEKPQAV